MKVLEGFKAETKEHLPVVVKGNDVVVTEGISFAVLPETVRPEESDWTAAATYGGESGVWIEDLAPGYYWVWVKVDNTPAIPVFVALHVRVS